MQLGAGMQVLVLVKPVLEPRLWVIAANRRYRSTYTLGDLKAKLKRIREVLENSGGAGKNCALWCPIDFHHVAVISLSGAAGLEDFQAEAGRLVQAKMPILIFRSHLPG